MAKRLPKHLKGPFVNAIYDRRKATIYLKREDGQYVTTTAYPSFFMRTKDVDSFPMDEFKKDILDTMEEGRYTRLLYDPQIHYKRKRAMIDICEEEGVKLFEADVSPIRRWFSDTGSTVTQKFRCLFFDLETHPLKLGFDDDAKKQHRIISFAAYDEEGNSWFVAANESSRSEEAKVIKEFLKIAKDYDVLLAWNGNDYDFFVLKARCKNLKIKVDWRDWSLLDHMLAVKKALMSISDVGFKRSFALDAIGTNVLGIKKIKLTVPPGKMHLLLGERVAELERYNRRDVEIMLKIEEKREFLKLHFALCSICRTFPNQSSIFPNELADGILLRLGIQENRHFPTRRGWEEDKPEYVKYEGAFVMDPRVGFHTGVQVPDFASLYPSIILSWNMSRETMLRDGRHYPPEVEADNAHATATGVRFRTDFEGMLPRAVRRLMMKRKEYANRAKQCKVGSDEWKSMNNLSTAVKVVTNSFYGLLGAESSRYHEREIARSITLTGQLLIHEMMQYFERKGYKSIYGDTDSVFVKCTPEEMTAELDDINNKFLPWKLNNWGCRECAVKLDFDKGFETLIMVTKKRYAGRLALHKGRKAPRDMDPEVKGIEVQRSDQGLLAQKLLKKFINMMVKTSCDPIMIDEEIRREGQEFFTRPLKKEEIQITKSVQKHPSEYHPKTTVVRVAEKMIEEGAEFFIGMKVPYIVVAHKPNVEGIHADKYDGNCDRVYYWTRTILPPILRLLEVRFPGYNFNNFKVPNQGILDFFGDNDNVQKKRRIRIPKQIKRRIRKPVK
jgi:DNA polymerase I